MNLVDANVLLYAVNSSDPKHREAKGWLDGALNGQEAVAFLIEDDSGNIVIEQGPSARAVISAGEPDFKRIMPLHTHGAAPGVSKKLLHFGSPLRVGGSAEAEPLREEAGPILAGAEVAFAKSRTPQVLRSFLPMPVMRVPPEPCSERSILIREGFRASQSLVLLCLRQEEPLEGRTRQLARVPGMSSPDLRISHIRPGFRAAENDDEQPAKAKKRGNQPAF